MREDRRKRYDDEFRHEALGLIKAGMGKHSLARRLAMPVQTAEKWIMKYRSNGEDAVMGAKGKRSYDWETKVAAARDHVDNDMAKTEVMAKYAIASVAPPLERWCRKYRTDGPEALRPKPKGRPRGAKSSLKPKPTRVQELAEEVACLCSMFLQQVRQRFESIVTVPGPVGLQSHVIRPSSDCLIHCSQSTSAAQRSYLMYRSTALSRCSLLHFAIRGFSSRSGSPRKRHHLDALKRKVSCGSYEMRMKT